jgi:hypothetical protein
VIDEDTEEGEAAKKIKPEVALDGRRLARDAHRIYSNENPCTTIRRIGKF